MYEVHIRTPNQCTKSTFGPLTSLIALTAVKEHTYENFLKIQINGRENKSETVNAKRGNFTYHSVNRDLNKIEK